MTRRILLTGILLGTMAVATGAQGTGKNPAYVEAVTAQFKPAQAAAGSKAVLLVTLKVADGYHVNANKPDDENSIPTEVTVEVPKGVPLTAGAAQFPQAKTISVGYSEKPVKVYEGTVTLSVPVQVNKGASGKYTLAGKLHLQGCNATACFPPATLNFSAPLTVRAAK